MKRKQLSIILGSIMGLAVAAPSLAQDQIESQDQAGGMSEQQAGAEQEPSSIMQMKVSDLEGMAVVTPGGEELGDIDKIVQDPQDQGLHAVLGVGGFLGIGEKQVTYPLEKLHKRGDEIVASTEISKEELEQQTAYEEANYQELDGEMLVAEAAGAGAGPGAEQADIASFEQLDTNSDGYISSEEAQANPELAEKWQEYDANSDDQLDQAEFSAFESEASGAAGEQPGAVSPMDESQPTGEQPGAVSPMDQSQSMGQEQTVSFEQLDSNSDGTISREEAQQHTELVSSWDDVDTNSDDQIDQAEFSAFEASSGQESGMDTGETGVTGSGGETQEEPQPMQQ